MLGNIKFEWLVDMSRHEIVPAHILEKYRERSGDYG